MAKYFWLFVLNEHKGKVRKRLERIGKNRIDWNLAKKALHAPPADGPIEHFLLRTPSSTEWKELQEFGGTITHSARAFVQKSYVGLNSLDGEEKGVLYLTGIFPTLKAAERNEHALLLHVLHTGPKSERVFRAPRKLEDDLWGLD